MRAWQGHLIIWVHLAKKMVIKLDPPQISYYDHDKANANEDHTQDDDQDQK
jgi:hypothetical protein